MSERKLVYVAGPIGESTDFYQRFSEGCLEVAQLGYQAVSPVDLCGGSTFSTQCHTWKEHMQTDIRALINCDGVYLLRNWENSRGARLEKLIADGLDMFVLHQAEDPNAAVKADDYAANLQTGEDNE